LASTKRDGGSYIPIINSQGGGKKGREGLEGGKGRTSQKNAICGKD